MKKSIRILSCPELKPMFERIGSECDVDVHYFDGGSPIDMIFCTQPDAVIMKMFMDNTDAIEVVNAYRMVYGDMLTYFAVILPFVTATLRRELEKSSVDRVIGMPFADKDIMDLIRELSFRKPHSSHTRVDSGLHTVHQLHSRNHVSLLNGNAELEEAIDGILHDFGMPCCEGAKYIRCAVILLLNAENHSLSMTGVIYPTVAREFGTTGTSVERRIRSAISDAWKLNDGGLITAYFGSTVDNARGKPSNSEFIAMLADRIRMEAALCHIVKVSIK